MNNILLILQREFLTRVKSRSFLLTTFLMPIAIVLFYVVIVFIFMRGSDTERVIAVVDHAGIVDKSEERKKQPRFRLFQDKTRRRHFCLYG